MKNRPVKHKADNAFRFKKFSDRIQEIDIRRAVLYHIDHVGEDEPTEDESYFHLALQKWLVLNLTEEFEKFYKPVRDIVTLPQVLLKKEFIFEHLFECLQSASKLSLQALLEFVVILAKELQEYFCEWLPKILYKLTHLLQDKDAEVVEWTLLCLAFLFKHLKKHLKKDFSLVLNLVMPILDDRRRKEHIQNFAIECFSYVARDIRDRQQLLQLIANFCLDNPNVVTSCGHLLFQIVHGVPGQFHSCAEQFFVSLFDVIERQTETPKNVDLWSSLLTCFVDAMLHEIAVKNVELYWTVFMKRMADVVELERKGRVSYFPLYLRSLLQLVKFKRGAFVFDHKQLIDGVLLVLLKMPLDVDNERTLCELVIAVLAAKTVNLSHLEANQLIRSALKHVKHYENFEHFILHSMNYAQFEQLIFPALLAALEEGTFPINGSSLELLCNVLQHKWPVFHDGSDYDNFRPTLDCTWSKYPRIWEFLESRVCSRGFLELGDHAEECCLALVACRYDKSLTRTNSNDGVAKNRMNCSLVQVGEELWRSVESGAKSNDGENLNGTALFSYCLIMEHLVATAAAEQFDQQRIIYNLLPLCSNNRGEDDMLQLPALRLLDLLLTYCARHHPDRLTFDLFQRVHDGALSDCLCDPRHDVRLLATHSLSLFALVQELRCPDELFMYELMHRVEATDPSIETYRTQLQLLQKLTYDSLYHRTFAAKDNRLRLDPLKYLLGVLYVNFKLIWQPTMEAISSYGQHMDVDAFWQIYKRQLTAGLSAVVVATSSGEEEDEREKEEDEREKEERRRHPTRMRSPTLAAVQAIRLEARHKPDFVNYRKHIWSLLPNFRVLLERKNRELVTMFFDFYERPYRMHMDRVANVRKNIRIVVHTETADDPDEIITEDAVNKEVDEEEEEEENDEDADSPEEDNDDSQWDGKTYHGQLMNYLSMFQNLPNPRTVYKAKQLYDVYLSLLSHKNAQIQKLALDCLLTYRDKVLALYKDHFSRLIDEKTFRDELSSFLIAENTSKSSSGKATTATATVLLPREHREPVMKLLQSILYGKMYTRLVAAKKGTVQARKTMVLRYVNGCTDGELMAFIKLCFGPFANALDESNSSSSLDECIDRATDIDLNDALHAKYLQSVVALIETMLEQFGTKGDLILRTLFKLLLLVLATVQAILLQAELGERVAGLSMYKGVRREAGGLLRHFFDQFDRYDYRKDELEAVFRFVVWPAIDNMPHDCTAVPTALFKLFHTWTKSPRYFVLLTKYRTPDRDVNPLTQVMKLLHSNSKASGRITNQILDMVYNLLTLDEAAKAADGDEADKPILPLTCQLEGSLLPTSPEVQQRFEGVVNFGSLILVPHLDAIIERLRVKLGQQQRKRRQQHVAKEVTGKRDLLILNRITELVVDKSKCDVLVALLLPILTSRTAGMVANEGAMVQMISSLIGLFRKTTCPERHIRTVAPLFESVTQTTPRRLLAELFGTFEDKALAGLIVELNAMNRRWVDQPDYDRRLAAFKVIEQWMADGEMDMNRGLVVLYHVFYYLRCDKDLAMRSTSSYCLRKTVLHLAEQFQGNANEKQYLFESVVLRAIKQGIVGATETLRNECIGLLGELARNYPHVHYVFADLQPLTNDRDKEVDFFENLIHLQTHRNARAMVKFVQLARVEGTAMHYRTLMDFLYPMVAVYLCNEKFVHNNALIDTTIECVAAVCRLLPFAQFQIVLRVFIKKLRTSVEYQKQMVKLVVAIIEEFHFDFSHCEQQQSVGQGAVKQSEKKAVEEKKTKKGISEPIRKGKEQEEGENEKEKEEDSEGDSEDEDDDDDDQDVQAVKRETKTLLKTKNQQKDPSQAEYVLMMGLVQSLNNSVFELSTRDGAHKHANKQEQRKHEEDEILRVPIALATVQLLKKVSKKLLDQNLPKILMKMCSYLKSRLKSVRIITRDVLRKMMLILGTPYLPLLLDLLTTLLSRGFQVHVLVVTLQNILDAMRPGLAKDGVMDKNMAKVLTVCMGDIFGQAAEEKEVAKIGSKTPEAKTSNKSYGILNIMASTISEQCLLDVVVPFKEQLSRTNSAKVVNKVQICFNKIINGLVENKNIASKSYLAFVVGILTENIAHLKFTMGGGGEESNAKLASAAAAAKKTRIERPDIFLIADEHLATKRREELIKKAAVTNAHVLNEFALNLLLSVLKNEKLDGVTFAAYVNPIVPHLHELIKGAHVRVITLAVKCISALWSRQIRLEQLEVNNCQSALVDRLFEVLRKYSGQDLSTNDENYQLIKASFKAIMSLIRFVDNYTIGTDQLRSLLFYVDQDLHNKQGIAFPLLRAIIAKKMFVPEIHETMQSVCKLAITSDAESVRDEARQILMVFFLEYPLGERFGGHMKFFMSQLAYEMTGGRESAVRMLQVIMRKVPKNIMSKNLPMTFLTLGTRMVNDDQPSIRALVSRCIEELLNRADKKRREELFDMVLALFDDPQPSHVEMAALYCGRFLNSDKDFESRIPKLLPVLVRKLTTDKAKPGRFVREMGLAENEATTPVEMLEDGENGTALWLQKARDHQLIQLLNFTARLFEKHGEMLKQERFTGDVDELAYVSQKLLAYEHAWVRFNACKVIGQILQSIDFELLRDYLGEELNGRHDAAAAGGADGEEEGESGDMQQSTKRLYLYSNPQSEIKSLVLDLCAQLRPDSADADMAEEVMKNLLIIAVILRDVPLNVVSREEAVEQQEEDEQQQNERTATKSLNLIWLIRRVNYIANSEVIHTPHAILLRTAIFNWIEGLVNVLDKPLVAALAPLLLATVMREVSPDNNNTHTELKRLANKIIAKMRKAAGDTELNAVLNKLQQRQMQKRAERKTKEALEKIQNPEKAVKRRVSQQHSKKMAKKRKMDIIKGKLAGPRKRKFRETNEDFL